MTISKTTFAILSLVLTTLLACKHQIPEPSPQDREGAIAEAIRSDLDSLKALGVDSFIVYERICVHCIEGTPCEHFLLWQNEGRTVLAGYAATKVRKEVLWSPDLMGFFFRHKETILAEKHREPKIGLLHGWTSKYRIRVSDFNWDFYLRDDSRKVNADLLSLELLRRIESTIFRTVHPTRR